MIISSLCDYYQRKRKIPHSGLPEYGRQQIPIEYIILLDSNGNLIDIQKNEETFTKDNGKLGHRVRRHLLPMAVKKTSGVAPNTLWDNKAYVLGIDDEKKDVNKKHQAFIEQVRQLPQTNEGIAAVLMFLDNLDLAKLKEICGSNWNDITESTGNFTFKLQNADELVAQHPDVKDAIMEKLSVATDGEKQVCLITGESTDIARLHPNIKGVRGAQPSGANIVSFNQESFTSYGKEQGSNAPIGERTAFEYVAAMNHMLNSKQHVRIANDTYIFWAEKDVPLEEDFSMFCEITSNDDPDMYTEKVRALLKSIESGGYTEEESDAKFFILGLSPNNSRLAIRSLQVTTVRELGRNIKQHYDDLCIDRYEGDSIYPRLYQLLRSITPPGKNKSPSPKLASALLHAIVNGGLYPSNLLQSVLQRVRIERKVTYLRAALIKAVINRQIRILHYPEKEITMSLDSGNTNIGYRLGRLFAVLERIQRVAQPNIKRTIADTYYGAMSIHPGRVIPKLMDLKNHHLKKLKTVGQVNAFNRTIDEIMEGLDANPIPTRMTQQEQGLFAIGYHHQRHAAFNQGGNSKSEK